MLAHLRQNFMIAHGRCADCSEMAQRWVRREKIGVLGRKKKKAWDAGTCPSRVGCWVKWLAGALDAI